MTLSGCFDGFASVIWHKYRPEPGCLHTAYCKFSRAPPASAAADAGVDEDEEEDAAEEDGDDDDDDSCAASAG